MALKIAELIGKNEKKKSEYIHSVKELENQILLLFEHHNYVYDPNHNVELFAVSSEERLKQVEEKARLVKENPGVVTGEYVEHLGATFREFLNKYNFGWMSGFKVTQSGIIEVVIICDIHTPFASSSPESDKINVESQIRFMNNLGFTTKKAKYGGTTFHASGDNISLMRKFFEERHAKHIEISTRDDEVHQISFWLQPQDIEYFMEDTEKVAFEVTDEMNDDEFAKFKKAFSEVCSSVKTLTELPDMMQTICNLIESYTSELSEIVGYEGIIKKRMDERFKKSREINAKIRDIKESLGVITGKEGKEFIVEAKAKLDSFLAKKLGLRCSEFSVDTYGIVTASLFVASALFSDYNVLSDEAMKEMYDITGTSLRDDDLNIIDNEKNRSIIEGNITFAMPSAEIFEMTVNKRNGKYIIRKIGLYIRNFADVYNLPDIELRTDEN